MFLNKTKEQLGPEKANAPFPHSSASTASPHYPTAVLAIPGSVDAGAGVRVVPKQEAGGGAPGGGGSGGAGGGNSGSAPLSVVGGHLHQSHTSQNITVVPVPSTGIMTAGEWATISLLLLVHISSHSICHICFVFIKFSFISIHTKMNTRKSGQLSYIFS